MRFLFPVLVVALCGLLMFQPWKSRPGKNIRPTVMIKAENGGFQLYRNGQPYYINGAAVIDLSLLHKVKASGGNSIRLYNTDSAKAILDSAHKLGLTVTLGLRLKQARMEMDYSDKEAVARQFEEVKKEVLRYKDHPALLMWAVGNETTLFIPPRYTNFFALRRVFKEVDAIAAMIHELDPNHPTTTVLANISEPLIRISSMTCKNIDLLSFNIFAPLGQYMDKVKGGGWKGPYLVTEFGAKGYWSTTKTDWYSHVEQTSYEKSLYLQTQYEAIKAHKAKCLGSYVFIWGVKQEYTPTWFSLFSPWPASAETELSDVCQGQWTGKPTSLEAPSIYYVTIEDKVDRENIYLTPAQTVHAVFHTVAQLNEPLRVSWEVQNETGEYLSTSYKTQWQQVLADSTFQLSALEVAAGKADKEGGKAYAFEFKAPDKEGPYRLYLYVENEHKKVSTANACFFVHKK